MTFIVVHQVPIEREKESERVIFPLTPSPFPPPLPPLFHSFFLPLLPLRRSTVKQGRRLFSSFCTRQNKTSTPSAFSKGETPPHTPPHLTHPSNRQRGEKTIQINKKNDPSTLPLIFEGGGRTRVKVLAPCKQQNQPLPPRKTPPIALLPPPPAPLHTPCPRVHIILILRKSSVSHTLCAYPPGNEKAEEVHPHPPAHTHTHTPVAVSEDVCLQLLRTLYLFSPIFARKKAIVCCFLFILL